MNYIDGFVVAVPKDNKQAYLKHAKEAVPVFKEHGALSLVECWGDDIPDGETTSFIKAVKCEPHETVCFSWLTWPSKEVRDKGMKKIMDAPGMQPDKNPMPFDGQRMIFGGFEVLLNEY